MVAVFINLLFIPQGPTMPETDKEAAQPDQPDRPVSVRHPVRCHDLAPAANVTQTETEYLMPTGRQKAAVKPAEAPQTAEKPKKASKYPYKKLVVPAALQGVENGKLSGKTLASVKCGGQMWSGAAEAFNRLYDQATLSGHQTAQHWRLPILRSTAGLVQAALRDRGSGPQTDRSPAPTKAKPGTCKPGMAPCSTPGKSNHGLGLAIDLDVTTAKVLDWMCTQRPHLRLLPPIRRSVVAQSSKRGTGSTAGNPTPPA
jgi:hypothetical protein